MKDSIHGAGQPAAYRLVKDWLQLPAGFVFGNPTGIGTDRAQNLFVFHRAGKKWPLLFSFSPEPIPDNTILLLDRNTGKILNSWGAGIFVMPHGLAVDKEDNVWVTDIGLQQVLKFSHEGALLMAIGEKGVAGADSAHFDRPTDIAITPDGSCYVSDGYRNSRVMKFSASGQYLLSWGRKGDQPGEFNLPHGIDLDNKGNVYVADRENSRVQVFDPSGKFLKEYKADHSGKIYAIRFDKTANRMMTADYTTFYLSPKGSDIIAFDPDGTVTGRFGRSGDYAGPVCRYHDLAIDLRGNVYVGDILNNTIQKFTPTAGYLPGSSTQP